MPSRSTPSLLVSAPVPKKERVAPTVGAFSSVALINPSGHGNLGDEAILTSAIENIRQRNRATQFVGITLRPTIRAGGLESRHFQLPQLPRFSAYRSTGQLEDCCAMERTVG